MNGQAPSQPPETQAVCPVCKQPPRQRVFVPMQGSILGMMVCPDHDLLLMPGVGLLHLRPLPVVGVDP